MSEQTRHVSEETSRKVAEQSRQTEWNQPSFMREMFLGNFRFDLVHPYPEPRLDRPEFVSFYSALQAFLRDDVDPAAIDELEDYPPTQLHLLLREVGREFNDFRNREPVPELGDRALKRIAELASGLEPRTVTPGYELGDEYWAKLTRAADH